MSAKEILPIAIRLKDIEESIKSIKVQIITLKQELSATSANLDLVASNYVEFTGKIGEALQQKAEVIHLILKSLAESSSLILGGAEQIVKVNKRIDELESSLPRR